MSKKTKPFHESILEQITKSAETLSKNKKIGQFINHFVPEVKTITDTIAITKVPDEHLPALILGLETFYKDFETQHPRDEDGCGTRKERALIEKYLAKAIDSLKKRL